MSRIFTWAIDYTLFGILLAGAIHFLSDRQLAGSPFEALKVFVWLNLVMDLLIFHDWLWRKIGSEDYISHHKHKTGNADFTMELFYYQIKSRMLMMGLGAMLAYVGLAGFPWSGLSPAYVMALSTAQFIGLAVFRDVAGMLTLHTWMHEHAYSLHKLHHRTTKECDCKTTFYFDWLDLFFENGIGVLGGSCISYFFMGQQIMLPAIFMMFWHDIGAHSVNPYFPAFLNPALDYLFPVTICHNLHHALMDRHYTGFPFSHLLPGRRVADVELYNKTFGTKVQ